MNFQCSDLDEAANHTLRSWGGCGVGKARRPRETWEDEALELDLKNRGHFNKNLEEGVLDRGNSVSGDSETMWRQGVSDSIDWA